ncbi:MAG: aminotransferase [Alphaproteobacteria bacterium]|nr:MAG: aminotransferase [Alphaproteobacteria bacterium]
MKPTNHYFSGLGTTIFTVMSALARRHGAINLAQGFPDDNGPDEVRAVAARALQEGPNQYPPGRGIPELCEAVAAHDQRFYGFDFSPDNVLVTAGATEALAASMMALVNPGDEAVIFEPAYDSYRPILEGMGVTVRAVQLAPPAWSFTEQDLTKAFSPRTKLVVLNSPMNPIGKVFSRDELELIASFVERHDCFAVCDEVYEHIVFDGRAHIPLMTLPAMAERTVRIGSAGKTFSLTGWKVGYISGPAALVEAINKVHQFLVFTVPPNLQKGVAHGLRFDDSYFHSLAHDMQAKRDRLSANLTKAGFRVLPSEGTYFLTADYSALAPGEPSDAFCMRITRDAGVAAIPLAPFYGTPPEDPLVRFCFCKDNAVLDDGAKRLERYFSGVSAPSAPAPSREAHNNA